MPEEVKDVAPVAPTPAPTPQEQLASQYDLGDTGFDPEVDSTEPVQAPASPDQPSTSAASPAPPAPPAAAAQAFSHPAYLIRLATDLGISADEIKSTPTDMLANVTYQLNRQKIEMIEKFNRGQPDTTPAPAPKVPKEADLFEDETVYDEGLVKAVKKADTRKELAALKAEIAELKQAQQVRDNDSRDTMLDRVFEEFKDERLGKGPMRSLQGESRDRRNAIYTLAGAQKDGSLEDRIKAAYKLVYGEPKSAYGDQSAPAAAPSKPSKELEQRREEWNGAGVARPTQREGAPEPKGERKAVATAARVMRESGLLAPEDDEYGGFPD